ncbi:MAG: IS110 family transposase [Sphingomonadales bacterium]|nr:IS110 family transposase [Sphingomonadales bacterium]
MTFFVGLDIALKKTAVCVVDNAGDIVFEGTTLSDPDDLIAKLERWRDDIALIGLEACPLSEWLHGSLAETGYDVRCLETRHTQRFLSTRPNKTDRSDAHGIASMMRLGHYKPVHVKSRQSQLRRALLIGRKQFMAATLQIENTIRGLMRVQGLKIGAVHRNRFSERVVELCTTVPGLAPAIEPLLAARDAMREQIAALNRSLEREARADELCRLFMTIPGVGPLTSLAFKATIDDPRRFRSSKTVPAHLGLTPRVYQSGEIDRSGHISKSGDKLMRYLLAEPASSMLSRPKKWCSLKAWGIRLAKRVGMGKAIVAVARKLAIVMHKMWLTSEPFRFGSAEANAKAQ